MPLSPDRRRQPEEPEARPRRAARRRVPDDRGRERRRGDRARGRAPAGRDPDGPPAPRHGRHGRRPCPRERSADGADPRRRADALRLDATATGCSPPGSPATSRSRSASPSSRSRCAATACAVTEAVCQHPAQTQAGRVVAPARPSYFEAGSVNIVTCGQDAHANRPERRRRQCESS